MLSAAVGNAQACAQRRRSITENLPPQQVDFAVPRVNGPAFPKLYPKSDLPPRFDWVSVPYRVNAPLNIRTLHQAGKTGLVGLLILLWLEVTVLATSPRLHQSVHSDAASPQHECIVTLLNDGKLALNAELDLHPIPTPNAQARLPKPTSPALAALVGRLPQGRAPPANSSSESVAG